MDKIIKIGDKEFNQKIENNFNLKPFFKNNGSIVFDMQEYIFLPEFSYNKGKDVVSDFYKNIKDFHKINREEHILYDKILYNSDLKEYYRISDLVNKGAIIKNIAPLHNQMFLENSLLPVQIVVPIAYSYFLKENGDKSQSSYLQYNCINEMFKQSLIPDTNNIEIDKNYVNEMIKINTSLVEDNFYNIKNKDRDKKQGLSVTNGILMCGVAEIEKQIGNKKMNLQMPVVFDIEDLFMYITNNLNNAISLLKIYQYSLVSYGIINDIEYANDLLDINKNSFLRNIFYNIVGKSQKMIKENIMPFIFYNSKNNEILANNRTSSYDYIKKNPFIQHAKDFSNIFNKNGQIIDGYTILPDEILLEYIKDKVNKKEEKELFFPFLDNNQLSNIEAKENLPNFGSSAEEMEETIEKICDSFKDF